MFSAKAIPALIKYLVFIFIGLIPVGYNSWWLYGLISPASPPSRLEVLAILFAVGSIAYWLWNMVSNYRNYSLNDFTNGDA